MGHVLITVLRCTVRDCAENLAWDEPLLRCPRGHTFDRAREGYWNLLQPQDRKSKRAGDRDDAVAARHRWLARGFADGLFEAVAGRIDALHLSAGAVAIDVGCGEGTPTARLLGGRDVAGCGIDLSTAAIRLAARAAPAHTWIVANADRGVPLASGTVALALSIFGRRPAAELHRVLADDGTLIVVVPGEDDLIELRALAQGEARGRDRVDGVLAELHPFFTLAARERFRHRAPHDRAALEDALAMTYRGARASEKGRIGSVSRLDVTLAADILALVPRDGVR
jgi:23S rRNA (guanine745-N1)-methyltransferase